MSARLTAGDVMTAAEVAALLKMPQSTVEHYARSGVLPSRKLGRRRVFLRPQLESLLLSDDQVPSKSRPSDDGSGFANRR
jgi:excisionase family DNA binding protein